MVSSFSIPGVHVKIPIFFDSSLYSEANAGNTEKLWQKRKYWFKKGWCGHGTGNAVKN